MPELRKDLVRDSWVLIAKDRALKPNDFPINKNGINILGNNSVCPFCAGNEIYTPPEIIAYRNNSSSPNSPGWDIRTIPNKYSTFSLKSDVNVNYDGLNTSCMAIGQHEVIIETPEHNIELHEFNIDKISLLFKMFQERYIALADNEKIKYIQIYKNRGIFAGASLEHSHSQILALPIVPEVNKGLAKYYQNASSCFICDLIEQERQNKVRVIYEGAEFIVISPYAPRFAYEIWVIPIKHTPHFGNISKDERQILAVIMQLLLKTIIATLGNPSYNIVINSAPIGSKEDAYHWFIEITPRLIITAGVEVATGIYMNPVSPELAAILFREKIKDFYKE